MTAPLLIGLNINEKEDGEKHKQWTMTESLLKP